MRIVTSKPGLFAGLLFGFLCSFNTAHADCSQVLAQTGRNLMTSVQENDKKAFFYNNVCKSSDTSIGAEFSKLQTSFGFSYGTKEQFCQEQASNYSDYGFASLETSNVVERALTVFLECRKLEKERIVVSLSVAPDKVTFDIGRGGNTTGILYGWMATEGVLCTLVSPQSNRVVQPAVERRNLQYSLPVAEQVQVSCTRSSEASSTPDSNFYPAVNITIFTSEGSMTAPIPADARVSETWATQIMNKIQTYDATIAKYEEMLAKQGAEIASLQSGKLSNVTLTENVSGSFAGTWYNCPPGAMLSAVETYGRFQDSGKIYQIVCRGLVMERQ